MRGGSNLIIDPTKFRTQKILKANKQDFITNLKNAHCLISGQCNKLVFIKFNKKYYRNKL